MTFVNGFGVGKGSQVMFSLIQPNLQANKKRKYVLSSQILKDHSDTIEFQWAAFPIEVGGASVIVPSPSGSKLLVVQNSHIGSPTRFEIWGQSRVEKEFQIPASVHGSVFSDGWLVGTYSIKKNSGICIFGSTYYMSSNICMNYTLLQSTIVSSTDL